MNLVPQLLAWVRAVLFGPPETGRNVVPEGGRSLPVRYPSPRQWATVLGQARQRRAPHLWPPAVEDDPAAALVRAYVLPEDERTRALAAPVGEVR